MLTEQDIKVRKFQATQEDIDNLKNEFFNKAQEFVYFRKGNWNGFEASYQYAKKWVKTHPKNVLTSRSKDPLTDEFINEIRKKTGVKKGKLYSILKDYFSTCTSDELHITFRALVAEGSLKTSDIEKWEKLSNMRGSIQTVPMLQTGYFRYLINEKRYAIFCRINEDYLLGILGKDKDIIDMLKNKFDLEYYISVVTHNQHNTSIYLFSTDP